MRGRSRSLGREKHFRQEIKAFLFRCSLTKLKNREPREPLREARGSRYRSISLRLLFNKTALPFLHQSNQGFLRLGSCSRINKDLSFALPISSGKLFKFYESRKGTLTLRAKPLSLSSVPHFDNRLVFLDAYAQIRRCIVDRQPGVLDSRPDGTRDDVEERAKAFVNVVTRYVGQGRDFRHRLRLPSSFGLGSRSRNDIGSGDRSRHVARRRHLRHRLRLPPSFALGSWSRNGIGSKGNCVARRRYFRHRLRFPFSFNLGSGSRNGSGSGDRGSRRSNLAHKQCFKGLLVELLGSTQPFAQKRPNDVGDGFCARLNDRFTPMLNMPNAGNQKRVYFLETVVQLVKLVLDRSPFFGGNFAEFVDPFFFAHLP